MKDYNSYIDLVDAQGKLQKMRVPKLESRDYAGLYAQVVIVVLFDEKKRILVHKRKHSKEVNPGDIDFVCGMVEQLETPLEAAIRETREETGLEPRELHLVHQGVNSYGRYRFLFTGQASGIPKPETNNEVEWVAFLHRKNIAKSGTVVDEFFEDLAKIERHHSVA